MKIDGNTISISATDLVGHLNCAHLTELDLAVARGERSSQTRRLEIPFGKFCRNAAPDTSKTTSIISKRKEWRSTSSQAWALMSNAALTARSHGAWR